MTIPFHIFPVGPDKAPLVTGWQDKATKDPATIAQWQAQGARAWGIPTGARAGLFVIDLDVDKATGEPVGEESLKTLPRYAGLLDKANVHTPSGGRHIYCQHFEGARNSTSKIGPKIDTRGEGGYVVAPGSKVAGGFYAGSFPDVLPKVPMGLRAMLLHTPPAPARTFDRPTLAEVEEALTYINADLGYDEWLAVLAGIHDTFGADGLDMADRWSAKGEKYKPGEVAAKFKSFTPGKGATLKTLFSMAQKGGCDLAALTRKHRTVDPARLFGGMAVPPPPGAAPMPAPAPPRDMPFFNASDLQGQPVPPREWLVDDLIPMKTVTLLGGDGGTGKSLLALQLAVGVSANRAWINNLPRQGRALYLSAEDDRDELHRRLSGIRQNFKLEWGDLSGITVLPLAGEDALLAHERPREALAPSPLFHEIEKRVANEKPILVVLDTQADLFPGNENDRAQVRQFVSILRGLAIRHGCAIVLLSHPSLTGMHTGTGASGSTAWNNSVRSRLYLERVKVDGCENNPDLRVLSAKKANYGPAGSEIHMVWHNGTFVRVASASATDATAKAERVFLELLRKFTEQGRNMNANGGTNYAPSQFAQHDDGAGITKRAFANAMGKLLDAGKIKNVPHGRSTRLEVAE